MGPVTSGGGREDHCIPSMPACGEKTRLAKPPRTLFTLLSWRRGGQLEDSAWLFIEPNRLARATMAAPHGTGRPETELDCMWHRSGPHPLWTHSLSLNGGSHQSPSVKYYGKVRGQHRQLGLTECERGLTHAAEMTLNVMLL